MKAALAVLLGITTTGTSLAQTTAAPASPAATPVPGSAKSSDSMEGLAAVYSDKLAGRKTASGEVFNQSKLTAAHPSRQQTKSVPSSCGNRVGESSDVAEILEITP